MDIDFIIFSEMFINQTNYAPAKLFLPKFHRNLSLQSRIEWDGGGLGDKDRINKSAILDAISYFLLILLSCIFLEVSFCYLRWTHNI